ncbi:HHL266Cp [Eremothecium sinecaudum]|uniref:HHL266Cp n=1 Tax=Eremothecium sinecaudum TaxID=45286 RepID=A0A0X8HVY7_9SACH|nr:HHL266Cp [Eremothecium sinecaudum]AMD22504.1 HHL266Cp [Eremothecium sinecaudum]
MVRTNREILSGGKQYKQKVSKQHGTTEVNFDKDSRLEFLNGFHKRKVARKKKAQEFAKEQERLMRLEERKKIRESRKAEMAEQLKKLKESMLAVGDLEDDNKNNENEDDETRDSDVESWHGFSDEEDDGETSIKPILKKHREVYENDATVYIEPMEPNDNFTFLKHYNVSLEKSEKVLEESINRAKKYAKFLGMEEKYSKPKKRRSRR